MNATPLLRWYAKRRLQVLERMDARREQHKVLMQLVAKARSTRFGRDHDFARIRSVREFRDQVPVRRHEALWESYWQPGFPHLKDVTWPGTVKFFALTSGTTAAASKHIPVTAAMLQSNRRAGLDTLCYHLRDCPDSKVFGGKTLMLGGSSSLEYLGEGVARGDLSGIVAHTLPAWSRAFTFPPPELALISAWDEKIDRMVAAVDPPSITAISGLPNWILMVIERLKARTGAERPLPNLELIVHGGVNFAPYRDRYAKLLVNSTVGTREVYPASEGFIASADGEDGAGLRLIADNGIFFEFIPVESLSKDGIHSPDLVAHWLEEIELGVDYAVAVSTNAGLWRYLMGDVVRFVNREPPRLLVTGRTSYMLSAFGEHLSGEEVEASVMRTATQHRAVVQEYSVGPIYPQRAGDKGKHHYVIECVDLSSSQREALEPAFAHSLDTNLRAGNDDYRAHRNADLMAPGIDLVARGTFDAWMQSRGKLGGQHKIPRVINDEQIFASLLDWVRRENPPTKIRSRKNVPENNRSEETP